jgi:hypothetical protein
LDRYFEDGGKGGGGKKNKICERVPAAGPARVQSRLVKSDGSEQDIKKTKPKKSKKQKRFFLLHSP